MRNNALKWFLFILPLVLFITALGICLPSKNNALFAFINLSYYIFLILLCLWSVYTVFFLRELKPLALIKENWIGIISALTLTAICFFFIDSWFRLLSDETNLLSVAQSMVLQKKVFLTKMGRIINGDLYPMTYATPKRPLLFSFIVSLVHNVCGYSFENAFRVNLFSLFSILVLAFITVKRLTSTPVAISTQILIMSQPAIPLHATSAGFDLFSTLFFWLSLFSVYIFMQRRDVSSFSFLWCTLLMFANIRYESFFFMVMIIVFLGFMKYLKKEFLVKNAFLLGISPLLFLPRILQTWISTKGLVENPEGIPPFSLDHLLTNTAIFVKSQFDFSRVLPYATVLNLISFLLLFIILILLITKNFTPLKKWQKHFVFLAALCISGIFAIFLPYYMGNYAHPSTIRFFLIPVILFSLIPAFTCFLIPGKIKGAMLCCLAVLSFTFYFPVAINNRLLNSQFAIQHLRESYTFLKKQGAVSPLIISDNPSQFIPFNFSAIDFKTANLHKHRVLKELSGKVYENIFVFQFFPPETKKPVAENVLDTKFKLLPLHSFKSLTGNNVQISKVILNGP